MNSKNCRIVVYVKDVNKVYHMNLYFYLLVWLCIMNEYLGFPKIHVLNHLKR